MLAGVVRPAQADRPAVAWLYRHAAACPRPDVRHLNRHLIATRNAAHMRANKIAVTRRAFARVLTPGFQGWLAAGEHQTGTLSSRTASSGDRKSTRLNSSH